MKKYASIFAILGLAWAFEACVTIQVNPDSATARSAEVQDDLYDLGSLPNKVVKQPKKSNYYALDSDAEAFLIEEEQGLANRSSKFNYLDYRSVYREGFQDGYSDGLFAGRPFNTWLNNPYLSFGTFGLGMGSRWGIPLAYSGFYDPWMSPWSMNRLYNPFLGSAWAYDPFFFRPNVFWPYGNYFGPVSTGYLGYYGPYGGSVPIIFNSGSTGTAPEPGRTLRNARMDRASNRYNNQVFDNTPRNTNRYNAAGSAPQQQSVGGSYRAPNTSSNEQRVAPRRSTNYNSDYNNYSAPSNNSYQNYNNSRSNFSSPSYGGSSGSSGGGSFGGGAGGGGSRGPR